MQGTVEPVRGQAGTARGQRHGASFLQAVQGRSERLRRRSGNPRQAIGLMPQAAGGLCRSRGGAKQASGNHL